MTEEWNVATLNFFVTSFSPPNVAEYTFTMYAWSHQHK